MPTLSSLNLVNWLSTPANPRYWFAPAAPPPPNPRKPSQGTTMTAAGVLPPPPTLDTELGSGMGIQIREVVPELTASQRIPTYARMMNDASCDVSIRAVKTPVLGADFFVDPFGNDQLDLDIAEFIDSNLFGGMSAPLANVLTDILCFFEDGYSVVEKVWEIGEWAPERAAANTRKFTMLKKLGVRPVSTIKSIEYDDNGGPVAITQNAIQADKSVKEVPIDIFKLIIFTFNRKGGDLTGKSLLRTAYAHWYYKTRFYKIDAIQKERHGIGVPKYKLQPGYTQKDRDAARTLVRNLRSNEESGMVLPPGQDVEFAELHGNLVDVLGSAREHNAMILLNVLAQFLLQGTEGGASGGRSSSGAQTDMFMKSLRFVANLICEMINMFVIPELVVYNFKTTNFPQLKVRNIGETRDLQMLGASLANLFAQGALMGDDDTEDWIRQVWDMPSRTSPRPTAPTPVPATPVAGSTNGAAPRPQKGNVGNNGGQGNTGKPTGAVAGVPQPIAIYLEQPDSHRPESAVATKMADGTTEIDYTWKQEKEKRPLRGIARKQPDGSTRVDYVYEEED